MSGTARAPSRSGMRGIEGKNVLVTGGTSGIGQAMALRTTRTRGRLYADLSQLEMAVASATRTTSG